MIFQGLQFRCNLTKLFLLNFRFQFGKRHSFLWWPALAIENLFTILVLGPTRGSFELLTVNIYSFLDLNLLFRCHSNLLSIHGCLKCFIIILFY